jgi:hypothetical protein
MYRLRILYAPKEDKTDKWVKAVEEAFQKYQELEVSSKSCQEASMTDFQAADIMIIGQFFENGENKNVCDNFKEILRALRGVNLAGRLAGFLSHKHDNVPLLFQEALKETDIRYFEEPLTLKEGKNDKKQIQDWVTRLYDDYKNHFSSL